MTKRGKELRRDHFKGYPTITLNRQIYPAWPSGTLYWVLVDIVPPTHQMHYTFPTHRDALIFELENVKEPRELLEWFEFREQSDVSLSSKVLGLQN